MRRFCCLVVLISVLAATGPLHAQWYDLADPLSNTVCGVINAADDALMVIGDDGRLVLIRGPDLPLANTGVDQDLVVYIDDEPAGTIDFANDGAGRRRAFWITPIGTLYGLTPGGEAVATDAYPDSVDGFCEPCDFWDNEADCLGEPAETSGDIGDDLAGALLANLCGAGGASAAALIVVGMVCLTLVPGLRPRAQVARGRPRQ